jgi:hypothetical protein
MWSRETSVETVSLQSYINILDANETASLNNLKGLLMWNKRTVDNRLYGFLF